MNLSYAIPYSKLLEHTIGLKPTIFMGEKINALQALEENIVDSVYKD